MQYSDSHYTCFCSYHTYLHLFGQCHWSWQPICQDFIQFSGLYCTSPEPEIHTLLESINEDHWLSLKSLPKTFLHVEVYPRDQLGNIRLGEQAVVVVDVLIIVEILRNEHAVSSGHCSLPHHPWHLCCSITTLNWGVSWWCPANWSLLSCNGPLHCTTTQSSQPFKSFNRSI